MSPIRSDQATEESTLLPQTPVCDSRDESATEPFSFSVAFQSLKRPVVDSAVKTSIVRRMVYDPRLPGSLVDRLWNDLDSLMHHGSVLSERPRAQVTMIRLEELLCASASLRGPHDRGASSTPTSLGIIKQYRLASWGHTLGHMFLPTRAQRSWVYGHKLLKAGLLTPRPLAIIEDRAGPLRFRSCVLTEFVPGTRLDRYVQESAPSAHELNRLAENFADIWHQLGHLRISHGDFYPGNLIVTPNDRLSLIDLDHMKQHWFHHQHSRQRRKDWKYFQKRTRQMPTLWTAFQSAVERRQSLLDRICRGA